MTDTSETDSRTGRGAQLWGVVKNAFTEEDPVAAARRAKLQGGQAAARPAPPEPPPADADAIAPPPLSPMARALMAQVLARPTAYTALTDKLTPLEAIVVDERTRYQAAYALIKASRTVEQVVQSIDMQHLQALETEMERFAAQLQEQERAEIGVRAEEARTLDADIDAAARQVARLREDADLRIRQIETTVARDRERLALVTREIAAKRQELAGVQHRFDTAVRGVRDALAGAKARVLRYLA